MSDRHCNEVAPAGPLRNCLPLRLAVFEVRLNIESGTKGGGPADPDELTVSACSVTGRSRGSPAGAVPDPKVTFCTETPANAEPVGLIEREL